MYNASNTTTTITMTISRLWKMGLSVARWLPNCTPRNARSRHQGKEPINV